MASPYQVGVDLSISTNGPQVLGNLAQHLLGLQGGVTRLTQGFANLRLGIIGAAFAMTGKAGISWLEDVAGHSEKLLDQQDKLMRGGIAYNDVRRIQADYFEKVSKQIPTSNIAEYLKTANELRSVTGSGVEGLDKAAALTPKAMMVDALVSNAMGHQSTGEYYRLLRSIEMKGVATDDAKRERIVDQMFSYITAWGGKISADDFQTLARRGGTAWQHADIEKALPYLAVAMADFGASNAGTAFMTLQQFQQGTAVLSKQQAEVMKKAGMLREGFYKETGFGGGKIQLDPGALVGSLEHAGDLPGWARDVLAPHLHALARRMTHVFKYRGLSEEAIYENLLGKDAPNRNASKMLEFFSNAGFLDQTLKDLGLAKTAENIPIAYQHFIERNPVGVRLAYNEQYESMMQAIGTPLMKGAMPYMRDITGFFQELGKWANSHPDNILAFGKAIAGISVTLTALGTTAVIAAAMAVIGPAGGLIIGLGLFATALLALKGPLNELLATLESKFGKFGNWAGNQLGYGIGPNTRAEINALRAAGLEPLDSQLNSVLIREFLKRQNERSLAHPAQGLYRHSGYNAPLPSGGNVTPIRNDITLQVDGRVLARVVSENQAKASTFQTSVGGMDSRATYGGPGMDWRA